MVPYVLILVPRVLVFSGTFFLVLSYFSLFNLNRYDTGPEDIPANIAY
jgi:hypothetical protein